MIPGKHREQLTPEDWDRPMYPQTALKISLILLACLLLGGCHSVFTIRPKDDLPPFESAGQALAPEIEIEARAFLSDAEVIGTFEGNLLLAGIVPVRVRVKNPAGSELVLSSARFELASAGGRLFRPLSAKKTFEQLLKYYNVRAYSRGAYANTIGGFEQLALDTRTPLASIESREGFLYFDVPPDAQQELDALVVKEWRLNRGEKPLLLRVPLPQNNSPATHEPLRPSEGGAALELAKAG